MAEKSVCKDSVTTARLGSGSDTAYKNAKEFKAEIIPYDDCESSNGPILAVSGGNMSLIFNIPKESFRKLAKAAIDHLGPDPDFKPPPEKSNGNSESGRQKDKNANDIPKSTLSDVVNLDSDSTRDMNVYEDSNEFQNSKTTDVTPDSRKSCINGNKDELSSDESVPNNCETGRPNKNTVMANSQKASNCEIHNVLEKFTESKSSQNEDGNIEKLEKDNVECPESHDTNVAGQNCATESTDYEEVFSACSPDLTYEECPELLDVWPEVGAFTETEEIPLEELFSSELDGVVTKYLKLGILNDFIAIKVTGYNTVCVSAVKYIKEKEPVSLQEESSECENKVQFKGAESCFEVSEKSISSTSVKNLHEDSIDDNGNCEQEKVGRTDVSEDTKNTMTEAESVFLQSNLKTESGNSIAMTVQNLSESTCNHTTEVLDTGSLKSSELDFEGEKIQSKSTSNESKADEIVEHGKLDKSIHLQIEQKLKELNTKQELDFTVSGTSPTERLRLTLNDSLTSSFCKGEAEQTDKSIPNMSEDRIDEVESSALGNIVSESEMGNDSNKLENLPHLTQCHDIEDGPIKDEKNQVCERNGTSDVDASCFPKPTDDPQNESCDKDNVSKNVFQDEVNEFIESRNIAVESIDEEKLSKKTEVSSPKPIESSVKEKINIDISGENLNGSSESKDVNELDGIPQKEHEKADFVAETDATKCSKLDSSLEIKPEFERVASGKCEDIENKDVEVDNIPKLSTVVTKVDITLNESFNNAKNSSNEAQSECSKMESLEQNSECVTCPGATDEKGEFSSVSFTSNVDSFMDTTADTPVESMSESEDVKSVASESDDGEKQASARKGVSKKTEADEVDCAPTRIRSRKAVSGLSKDAIPENVEVKNSKSSDTRGMILNTPLKNSGRTSPILKSLRSKSCDSAQQPTKGILSDKKHSGVLGSEEANRKTRAKTPDMCRKDLKTVVRSSPRKGPRSAAVAESSSTSKVQATKSNDGDAHSKSRANVDSASTKRSKRGSTD